MSEPAPRHTPGAPRLLILTALFPGLGHLVARHARWALVLGAPVLLLLAAGLLVALTGNGVSMAARLLDPAVLSALVVLQLLVLVWRLIALGAVRVVTPLRATSTTVIAAAVALAIVVGPQLWLTGLTLDARDAATEVFAPVDDGGAWVPVATAPPVASDDPDFATQSPSPSPSVTPSPSPTPEVPRVNVLLIGIDSGVGRNTALTDTMIVASLDPVGGTVSLASIPRDMVDVPLPDGRKYRGKINSLVSYVRWHPNKFPGAKDGQSVLTAAIGTLLEIRIDYWAQVNLGGFVSLVDSVGGVVINVTDGFCDPRYDEYGVDGFGVSTGRYRMDGKEALAYARVRKAAGESDFTRAARQQEVVAALRDRIVKGAFLDNPTRFLKSVGRTISTNVKPSLIADFADAAAGVGRKDVFRTVIRHPLVKSGFDERGSIQVPNLDRIRRMAARLFTTTGVRPEGFDTMPSAGSGSTKNASSSNSCGIKATPKPAKPTPKPTAGPTATPGSPTPTPEPEPTPTPEPEPTPTPEPEPTPPPEG